MVAQITFKKSFALPNSFQDISSSVQEINDNYFLFGSSFANKYNSSNYTFDLSFLKINSIGDTIYSKSLNGVNDLYSVNANFPTTTQSLKINSFIYLISCSYDLIQSKNRYSIFKINNNLDTIWSRKFKPISSDTLNYSPIAITQKSQNDIIVLAKAEANVANIQQVILADYDSLGNLKWLKKINNPFSQNPSIVPSSLTYNKTEKMFYLSGYLKGSGYGDWWGNPWPFIIKVDSIGNYVWEKHIYQSINNRHQKNFGIITTSDNNQIFAGYTVPCADSLYVSGNGFWHHKMPGKPSLTKINNSGNVIWRNTFEDTCHSCGDTYFNSLIETYDNKVVAIGNGIVIKNDGSFDTSNVIVAKLDLNGVVIWKKNYLFCSSLLGDNIWVNEIKQTLDSGFIITGSSFCKKFIIIKLDKNGCLFSNCPSLINNLNVSVKENNLVEIFPNPTNETIYIEFKELGYKNIKIQLINTLGQVLMEANQKNILYIKDLPNGIYFVNIFSTNNLIVVKKIIKE